METKNFVIENAEHCKIGGRTAYYDMLRLIALSMILFHHTGDKGYVLFTVAKTSPFYYFYMIWGMLQTCGVDIFLLISGALLLKKTDTWQYNIEHRVMRFIIA